MNNYSSITRLSVNLNKVALIRNARGANYPNLLQFAKDCERYGAQGITVHPRPDERHTRYEDVYALSEVVTTEFNVEGFPNERFLKMIEEVKPDQCALVPDDPSVITSDAGWDISGNKSLLTEVISRIQNAGARVSLFIEADERAVEEAKQVGADRVELYTGPYAHNYSKDKKTAVKLYAKAAKKALDCNIGLNAGHDLNSNNLRWFCRNVPGLLEVSIGHAIICEALYWGIENTIQLYLRCLKLTEKKM